MHYKALYKEFNQMAPSARTGTVALDMKKSFRHNKHKHTNQKVVIHKHSRHNHKIRRKRKVLYNIQKPHIHTTSIKPGVSQGGVPSPTLYNIYTADLPPPRAPVQVMAYVDDIIITATHTSTTAKKLNTHNHTYVFVLPGQNKTISH